MSEQHPTPWSVESSEDSDRLVDANGETFGQFQVRDRKRNVKRIIHAVNCHDELLKTLKTLQYRRAALTLQWHCTCCRSEKGKSCEPFCELNDVINKAEVGAK